MVFSYVIKMTVGKNIEGTTSPLLFYVHGIGLVDIIKTIALQQSL